MSQSLPCPEAPPPAGRPRLVWALLWLLCVPLAILVDRPLHLWYDQHIGGSGALDQIAQFLTDALAFPWSAWVIVGALLLLAFDRRLRWRFAIDLSLTIAAQGVAVEALKKLFCRVRPEAAAHLTIFRGPGDFPGCSFPSGHATAAFALAGMLTAWYPRGRWAFVAAAMAVALARVQLDRHFFSDVIFGAFIGWYLAWAIIARRRQREARRCAGPPAHEAGAPAADVE